MKVGINYIPSIPQKVIKELIKSGTIDVLKFPGIACNYEEMKKFLKALPKEAKADIHGLVDFKPAWNSPNITQKTVADINMPLFTQTGSNTFSTHIGQFQGDGDPLKNFADNLKKLKEMFPDVRFGGENVFSLVDKQGKAHYMTKESCTPEFINEMWQLLDFGVFDIAHVVIAAKDNGMTFLDYIDALKKEKVEIIHISNCDSSEYYKADIKRVDLHTPCGISEFETLKAILPYFPNVKLVISEIAYSLGSVGQREQIKVQDYVREAKALKIALTKGYHELEEFFEGE